MLVMFCGTWVMWYVGYVVHECYRVHGLCVMLVMWYVDY
jgi:hypothetical protein